MFPLYLILDTGTASRHGWRLPDLARVCAVAGARLFQVRHKGASGRDALAEAEAVVATVRETADAAVVIINDRADIAALAGADGVHVGQDDLPPEAARVVVGERAIVGLSAHTAAQVADAARRPLSYVAVGPVFGTATKDTGYGPVGLDLVRLAVRGAGGRPVVAIGGMTLERVAEVRAAGAASGAVISDLFASGDPAARVSALIDRVG